VARNSSEAQNSETDGRRFWERLLDPDDPTAPSDFIAAYLDELGGWLIRQFPRADEHLCWQAAEDTLLDLAKQPTNYQPNRLPLRSYLRLSAKRDLLNLLDSQARRDRHHDSMKNVELSPRLRNYLQDAEGDPAELLEAGPDPAALALAERALAQILEGLTAGERAALELQLAGERATSAYAQALGIIGLSQAEQEREVKRVKDKLKKRIERARGRP
jgi:DNA-directed RNA polymerase specialized sigma24 family protein